MKLQPEDTLNNQPCLMTVIINIQAMSKIIGDEIPFKRLEKMTSYYLHELQDELIPEYNKAIKK